MSRPKVQKRGRRLRVSWDSARRLNVTAVYPARSSNGSTILISGTDKGLHFSWLGGRPLYFASRGHSAHGEPSPSQHDHQSIAEDPESDDEALFESDDEQPDEDHSPHHVVQDLHIDLPGGVLHIAVPSQAHATSTDIFSHSITVAVTCEDGTAHIVQLPLDPPSGSSKQKRRLGAHIHRLGPTSSPHVSRGIAITASSGFGAGYDPKPRYETRHGSDQGVSPTSVVVAVATSECSGRLDIYSLPVARKGSTYHVAVKGSHSAAFSTQLNALPVSISFNTAATGAARHTKLLISDVSGNTSIFDIAPQNPSGVTPAGPRLTSLIGSPYNTTLSSNPSLSKQKRVLSAQWVLGGQAALTLLEDGVFRLYILDSALTSPTSRSEPLDFFAFEGYIGDAPEHHRPDPPASSKRSHLVPMTPNTRRARAEGLFSGPVLTGKSSAPRGGISTHSEPSTNGKPDDSVVLWYNDRAFLIPSLTQYWSRTATSSGQKGGNLYGTGISAIEDVDLANQSITGVALLPTRASTSLGQGPRDVLVSAQYKSIVLSQIKPRREAAAPRDQLSPSRTDQRLLDRGELGIDGMDRLLDSMVGVEPTFATSRKVAFPV